MKIIVSNRSLIIKKCQNKSRKKKNDLKNKSTKVLNLKMVRFELVPFTCSLANCAISFIQHKVALESI